MIGKRLRPLSPILLLTLLVSSTALAQGTVTGSVTDGTTGDPIPGVNVIFPDFNLGSATDIEGNYTIDQVPEGEQTLEIRFIGYKTLRQPVNVPSGETLTLDVQLEESALSLDEVVVTGTAGQARRREVGNSISSIAVRDLVEPPLNMDNLLAARAPGVNVNLGDGLAGSGAQVRLRGNTSISMSNNPLIYVDGIRVRSDGYPKNVPPVGYDGRSSNTAASPLNDINPSDIDRIEIIKGAAATTLYGTEAASGVIQIFTKSGAAGTPRWSFQVDQGFRDMQPFGPDTEELRYMRIEPWLRNGHTQKYAASVGGGGRDLRYFVSATMDDAKGVLPDDSEKKYVVRGNFNFSPYDRLQLSWNTSYTNDDITNPPAGNNAQGITLNVFRDENNYFGDDDPALIDQLLAYKINTAIDHLVTGGTALYEPFENFSNKLTVGYDRAESELRQYRPFGFILAPQGIMSNQRWASTTLTVEYVGSYNWQLTEDFGSSFSVGGQSVNTETNSVTGYGENFSAPGEPTLSAAAQTLSFEERIRVVNAGAFVQNLFSYRDRYFLTLGLRVDGNSAFGQNFGLQPYPKASFSYVVSDEAFWRDAWGQLKLRAAYGHAGRAPGAFDAVRTWNAAGWGGVPAFLPNTVGNPDLGPERTAELEMGFDAGLFADRLRLDFTYYNQRTTDALLPVRQIPSMGFVGTQLRNVGTIRNKGVELAANMALLDRTAVGWDVGLTVATNFSNVEDLGDAPPFSVGGGGWVEESGPVIAIRGMKVTNPDAKAEPDFANDSDYFVFGPNQPTHTVGISTSLRLPLGIAVSARGEYMGGHYIADGASSNMAQREALPHCQMLGAYALLESGNRDGLSALDRARCDIAILSSDDVQYSLFVYPADFFRLRDVTVRVPVPIRLSGTGSASLALSLRNVRLWLNDDFLAFDPEMVGQDGINQPTREITEHIPAPYSVTASLRVTL